MFSSSGKSELRIDVVVPQSGGGYFLPGETLSGNVVYNILKEQEQLQDASIEFTGKIYTEVTRNAGNNNRVREKEIVRLFHFRKSLYQGNYTMKAQTLSWPFEFQFPTAAGYTRRDDANPKFARSGSIPLPPSFVHETGSFNRRGNCYIKYKLKAYVNNTKTFGSKNIERPLILRHGETGPLPSPSLGSVQLPPASWQSRKLRQESHSFSQKMAHVFTSNPELRNPSINFQATLQVPTVTTESQPSDMTLSVKQMRHGPTDPEAPALVLADVRVFLEAETELRVERSLFSGSYYDDGWTAIRDCVFKAAPDRPPLALDGSPAVIIPDWRLADLRSRAQVVPVPDFSTWTVRHRNRLSIELDIIHPDSGHVFKLKTQFYCQVLPDEVRLLPNQGLGGAGQAAAQMPVQAERGAGGGNRDGDEDEQLPAYSKVPDAGPSSAAPPPDMYRDPK